MELEYNDLNDHAQSPCPGSGAPHPHGAAAGERGLAAAGTGPDLLEPPSQEQGAGGGRQGRGGFNQDNSAADFSPKAPIQARRRPTRPRRSSCRPAIAWSWCCPTRTSTLPAVIEFDGNGRMYVAEFVTYMPDVDGTGQREPTAASAGGKSTKGDGSLRQAHRVRRQADPAAHDPAARQRQHPDQRDATRTTSSSGPTPTATASPTSRRCSTPASASAATATSSTSRAASSGAWTTGSTAPTTRSASAGRRPASCASRPARTAASGA